MKRINGNLLFAIIAFVLVSLFVGYDYFGFALLRYSSRYTTALVTRFVPCHGKPFNNRIHYSYSVYGREHRAEFRERTLSPDLEGRRILVRFSPLLESINEPLYLQAVPDGMEAPPGGWERLPAP